MAFAMSFEERALQHNTEEGYISDPWHVLALQHYERFTRTERLSDVDEAISLARESIRRRNGQSQSPGKVLTDLRMFLARRFEQTNGIGDLEQAIEAARGAVHSTPYNLPMRAIYLNNLGNIT